MENMEIQLVGQQTIPELTEEEINSVSGGAWISTRGPCAPWGDSPSPFECIDRVFDN